MYCYGLLFGAEDGPQEAVDMTSTLDGICTE